MKLARVMFASGHIEEGLLQDWNENKKWVTLTVIGHSNKRINIRKKYIAAYQIEDFENSEEVASPEKQIKKPVLKNFLLKNKQLAESRVKEEVSKEYSDNVYSSQVSILKK